MGLRDIMWAWHALRRQGGFLSGGAHDKLWQGPFQFHETRRSGILAHHGRVTPLACGSAKVGPEAGSQSMALHTLTLPTQRPALSRNALRLWQNFCDALYVEGLGFTFLGVYLFWGLPVSSPAGAPAGILRAATCQAGYLLRSKASQCICGK